MATRSAPRDERSDPIEAAVRARPEDAEASQVWADRLCERGDARGEVLALEHALRAAPPEQARALSARLAALLRERRSDVWGKPGGFPFREEYLGRRLVRFASALPHRMRGVWGQSQFLRLHAFAQRLTDVRRPEFLVGPILAGELDGVLGSARTLVEPANDQEKWLALLLEDSRLVEAGGKRLFVCERRDLPLSKDALEGLVGALEGGTIVYQFHLTWPGTGVALPYQESSHYSGAPEGPDGMLPNRIALRLYDRALEMSLHLPFESFEEPGFLRFVDEVEQTLGKVLTPTQFSVLSPAKGGRTMKARRERFPP